MVDWKKTVITLIPKVDAAKNLKYFRPIALCNVLYKIVSKALANRLKHFLSEVIDENQSAFVAGRQINDNILIGFECNHWLRGRKKGYVRYCAKPTIKSSGSTYAELWSIWGSGTVGFHVS